MTSDNTKISRRCSRSLQNIFGTESFYGRVVVVVQRTAKN